ncbi:hypothetical protein H2203_001135 [Taxawa tesnikishii (nom. ined.)]|nr:hypothetical protein H2203_001135 [Dothideales sp. JES 119]
MPPPAMPAATNGQNAGASASQAQAQTQTRPGPPPALEGVMNDLKFKLVVAQQPVRARMCGFGDKDRRPITPPPCIQLVVTSLSSGKEIPHDMIDPTFFVLQVDLWDETGTVEKNVVRSSSSNSSSSAISSASTTSFPPTPDRLSYANTIFQPPPAPQMYGGYPQQGSYASPTYQAPSATYAYQQQFAGYPPQPQMPHMVPNPQMNPHQHMAQQSHMSQQPHMSQYGQLPPVSMPMSQPGYVPPPPPPPPSYTVVQAPIVPAAITSNNSMFTRNLIGQLSVNAFSLHDEHNVFGHWFVLQDLSVRTEGIFRLKMNFVNVGTNMESGGNNTLHKGRAKVLATCFSEPFQVYSAKKFPGVIESTPLSKCFAQQGIKIPIRKEGQKADKDDEDEA